jgi:heterodisulfide reductase subunit A
VLIAACQPYAYAGKLKELAGAIQLDPALMDVVDLMPAVRAALAKDSDAAASVSTAGADVAASIKMALARIARAAPQPLAAVPVTQRAVVVGGGIAGMTAALDIADHGFPVVLVEQQEMLGGNLRWLATTAGGEDPRQLREHTIAQVAKHPRITVMVGTRVSAAAGQVGHFVTALETDKGTVETIEHGVVVLATGGHEAPTRSYEYGTSGRILTQKELETGLAGGQLDPTALNCVAMIQCVDSRQEPRNYCSRVCCTSSLKHALRLKQANPELAIFVFYRDIMAYGFNERYFTQARQAGVIFISYDSGDKPRVSVTAASDGEGEKVCITAMDRLLGRPVEVEADLLVLATGVVPDLSPGLAVAYGIDKDQDGFFAEAESKWRPVDGLKEGVFACGLALSPRSIPESVASAGAAAQRALRILNRDKLPAGRIVAMVRHSLCSLCERCIPHCPYGARTLGPDLDKILVNPAMCQGCGACAAACLNGAAVVSGLQDPAMLEAIDAALAS